MFYESRTPIVSEREFILATRDTGYRTTAAAIAELLDNSLQAQARSVEVLLKEDRDTDGRTVSISVLDDGTGMDAATLRRALQFGGTDRFDDRAGAGRFGMGLPNSSVSQARRLDVISWQCDGEPVHSYLDVDEIAAGTLRAVPDPQPCSLPAWVPRQQGRSGTVVTWSHCDRLDNKKASTVAEKLKAPLGRMFRYFLWHGVRVTINGEVLEPVDPLFHRISRDGQVAEVLAPLIFQIQVPRAPGRTAKVTVRFAMLPVEAWAGLTADEKRRWGIAGGAGVSVVRANREVAYGWYLMGNKRRENYDDWWRCEVAFDPELDELFGVTHSKQGVTPTPVVASILAPTLEGTARTLNRQVRDRFLKTRRSPSSAAAARANANELFLPSMVPGFNSRAGMVTQPCSTQGALEGYRLTTAPLRDRNFYSCSFAEGIAVVVINENHVFFESVYAPLMKPGLERHRINLECMLLASARADLELGSPSHRSAAARRLRGWSNALATFLGG